MFPVFFQLQVSPDSRFYDIDTERFDDIIYSVELESFVFVPVFCRDEDDRDVRNFPICLEASAHFITIESRHHYIQEDKIGCIIG